MQDKHEEKAQLPPPPQPSQLEGAAVGSGASEPEREAFTASPGWASLYCPWMGMSGEAGSLEYATQTRQWFEEEFGGEWELVNDGGWWSAQEKGSKEEPNKQIADSEQMPDERK